MAQPDEGSGETSTVRKVPETTVKGSLRGRRVFVRRVFLWGVRDSDVGDIAEPPPVLTEFDNDDEELSKRNWQGSYLSQWSEREEK